MKDYLRADFNLVHLCNLSKDESDLVLSWRNHPSVRNWMLTSSVISSKSHSQFVKNLATDETRAYWLVKREGKNIGVVYLIEITNDQAELGMYASPNLIGMGQGSWILERFLKFIFDELKLTLVRLSVLDKNHAAIALYQKFGFIQKNKKGKIISMEKRNMANKERCITIGDRKIGPGHPAFIVAELSCNHLQKPELAVKTIMAMKEAGVDAVKIQTYTPDTMTVDSQLPEYMIQKGTIWDGLNLHDLYKEAYTPWDWQPKLQGLTEMLGMVFFSSPFDISAADFLTDMSVPAYKIASFEIQDIPLIRHIAKKGKPIIMSTGIAELEDIELAIKTCLDEGNDQIAILKCTSAYPSPMNEINLKTMEDMIERFGLVVGLSDHTLGSTVPIAAIALGASIIEKHFILDRKLGGYDGPFSMEPAEFAQLVKDVRDAEAALGTVTYQLGEKATRGKEFGRSLRATAGIKKGEKFSDENIGSKRPAGGLHPKFWDEIIGKKAKMDIQKGAALTKEMFEE